MPIYEYECEKCGTVEEIIQKFSDRPLRKCGHCSGKLHKLVSQSSFHLKGTGWYATDYAGKKQGASPSPKVKETPDSSAKEVKAPSSDTGKKD